MTIIICLSMLLLGFGIGYAVARLTSKPTIYGSLRIDRSDPDGPYMFLELAEAENVYTIQQQEYVTFKVNVTNYISQD